MIAVGIGQADQATETGRPITRLVSGAAEAIGTAIWLNLFHLVVAIPVIGMLARWLPGDRTSVEA